MPLKKVSNKDHKRRYKPWITNGILTSIKGRDKLLRQCIKMKDSLRKSSLQSEYKRVRNMIVELTKKSKQNYYNQYFSTNNSNLRKIWQGIKSIVNINSTPNVNPTCISDNGKIVTDPIEISKAFNNQ